MPVTPTWTATEQGLEGAQPFVPNTGNGLIKGASPNLVFQDTASGRYFQFQDTSNGFVLSTSTDGVTYTPLVSVTDVTQANVYDRLTGLQLDLTGLPTPSSSVFALRATVGSETTPRFVLGTDGTMNWGPGAGAATDTTLQRVAAAVLQTSLIRATSSPSIASDLTRKDYVDSGLAAKLALAGGTMTGDIVLYSGAPAGASSAVPKSYVDSAVRSNPTVFTGSGAPASGTLPSGITFQVGNLYWDSTNLVLYTCKVSGTNSTSVWQVSAQDIPSYIAIGSNPVTSGEIRLTQGTINSVGSLTLSAPNVSTIAAGTNQVVAANLNIAVELGNTSGGFYVTSYQGGQPYFLLVPYVSSAVNYLEIDAATTGNPVTLKASGSDTNRSLNLVTAGTGTVQANGSPVLTTHSATTQSSITVGASPFTYTNSDGFVETVYITGGTVSDISFIRNATTTSVSPSTNFPVILSPGDAVKVTYSAAPTMTKVPF